MPLNRLSVRTFPAGVEARPTWVDAVVLAANTAAQYTVPAGAAFLRISGEMQFFFLAGSNPTAAIAASAVTTGAGSQFCAASRWLDVSGAAKVSFISRTAGIVTIEAFIA